MNVFNRLGAVALVLLVTGCATNLTTLPQAASGETTGNTPVAVAQSATPAVAQNPPARTSVNSLPRV